MPVSVSDGYGAWHRGDETDTSTTFMTRANANPARNPKLFIAYGFEYQLPGGNRGTGDPGPDSIFYKTLDRALKEQGVTPPQVQIVWLSMPVSGKSWGTNLPPDATAQRLSGERIDAIYASPYRRSQETAAALAQATGLRVETIDGLAEIGVAVDGLTQEEVDHYFVAGSRRPLHQHWEGWPGSESFRDFHARVTGALADALGRHGIRALSRDDFTVWEIPEPRPRIAIVAHGGTNAVALAHLLDVRPVPWEWIRFVSELAAFSVVQARPLGPDGQVWSLQNFNELDHLRAEGLREP